MSTQNTTVSVNFGGLVFLVLLILKLTDTVAWSWWIITLPIWMPLVVFAGIFFVLGLVAFGKYIFK